MIHKAQIEIFLSELRKAGACKHFVVIPREKNNAFLARSGMTPVEREGVQAGSKRQRLLCEVPVVS
jgi:hypothetical protein